MEGINRAQFVAEIRQYEAGLLTYEVSTIAQTTNHHQPEVHFGVILDNVR